MRFLEIKERTRKREKFIVIIFHGFLNEPNENRQEKEHDEHAEVERENERTRGDDTETKILGH